MTTRLTRLSAALADRYRIERELGQGGMATVRSLTQRQGSRTPVVACCSRYARCAATRSLLRKR